MIALYGPGICLLRYLNFPAFLQSPEFSGDLHDHQSRESLSYADILHSSMPEDISGIITDSMKGNYLVALYHRSGVVKS